MSTDLSSRVEAMLDTQKEILDVVQGLIRTEVRKGRRLRTVTISIDDRRDMYWRLTDDGASMVYASSEADLTSDELREGDVFVDEVWLVWRPVGETFVAAVVNTGLGEHDIIALLRADKERRP